MTVTTRTVIDFSIKSLLAGVFLWRVYANVLEYNLEWVDTIEYRDMEADLTFPSVTACPAFDKAGVDDETNLTRIDHMLGRREDLIGRYEHEFKDG